MTRVYVPATWRLLRQLDATGRLAVGDDVVVVPDGAADQEDLEYDALMTAAGTSALLAAELDPGERRRVVVVAETTGEGIPASVALSDVVAVHADSADLAEALDDPGQLGDLCWYATQEIGDLLHLD